MWALRRSAISIRGSCQCLRVHHAFYTSLNAVNEKMDHVTGTGERVDLRVGRCAYQGGPFCSVSSCGNICVGCRAFSSQVGARSSDEEELEDGFSELESSEGLDNVRSSDAVNPVAEIETSDEEPEGDMTVTAQDAGALSDTETSPEVDRESVKAASSLFTVILEATRPTVNSALDKWLEEGNNLGRAETSVTLLNLRKRKMFGKALQFMAWIEAKKLLNLSERDYASRVDLIAKIQGLDKAEKYIERIPAQFRGEVVYRTLLANCSAATNVQKAEAVFNKMRDLGFTLTAFSCNQLLLLYKKIDRKKIADVLLMMEKENVKPSLFTYRLLIDVKGRSSDIEGMEKVLESMKSEGTEPDLPIQAALAKHYINGGSPEKAEAVLKEMEDGNLKENLGACSYLLPLYAALGKAADVDRVWDACGCKPRLVECVAAIEAWDKLGQVENAEAVFEKMRKAYKSLSSRYYSAMLRVYANHKLLAKGKDLVKKMTDDGRQIGPLTWDSLVKLYVESGAVEKADSLLQKASLNNRTLKPLYSSYITILRQYAERGDVHNAEKIFQRLRQAGYAGRMQQYHTLLQAYLTAKAPAYGFRERMKADNVFPTRSVAGMLAQVDSFKKANVLDLLE